MSKPRRGRPPSRATKDPLTRERILDAALALADARGLEGLSVRTLAAALEVTPMAVYNHVEDKQAILTGIFDRVVATYRPTDHDEASLADWLVTTFVRMRTALVEHPALVPLIHAWFALGPGSVSMDVMEACLARLRIGGFDDAAAVRAFYVLVGFTAGHAGLDVATRVHRVGSADALRRYRASLETSALDRHPTVVGMASSLAKAWDGPVFEDELHHLVAHLRPRLTATRPRGAR